MLFRLLPILLIHTANFVAIAQQPNDIWMLKEMLKDSTFNGEIVNRWYHNYGPIFLPSEAINHNWMQGRDNLIKNRNGLFTNISSTGKVYHISLISDTVIFTRIDSTIYEGYNNAAYVFSNNDTIYSLGGYGFWHFNGDLRYYRQSSRGWEVAPLNKRINFNVDDHGIHYDQQTGKIFYVTGEYFDEGIKRDVNDKPPISVYELNLKSKNWYELGIRTDEFFRIIAKANRIASLPWGELVYTPPQAVNKLQPYLLDYNENKIYKLKEPDKINKVFDGIMYNKSSNRFISYYNDSTLVVLTNPKSISRIPLIKSDFVETDISIYTPTGDSG